MEENNLISSPLDTTCTDANESKHEQAATSKFFLTKWFKQMFKLNYMSEFKILLSLQIPTFITAVLLHIMPLVSVLMAGRYLSIEEMDAVALANSLINTVGLGVGIGLTSASDTYFSQAFGSNKKRVGVYLQRSFIIMYMTLALVASLLLNVRPMLPHLQQIPVVAEMTSQYIALFLPGLFFDYSFMVLSRYLQVQNKVYPPMICAFIANIVNIVSQYLSIKVYGYRYLASAVCQVCSVILMTVCIVVYIAVTKVYKETWGGFSKEAFYDFWTFLKIGIPGILLIILEFGSFEAGIFVMGSVSAVQMGAQAAILYSTTITYMISLGLSVAITIRVGQQVGAMNAEGAKHSFKVGLSMSLVIATVLSILYALGKHQIGILFNPDKPDVAEATAEALKCYVLFPYVDGISAAAAGVLKGCGKQVIGAIGNFLAYIVIALPLGISLALKTRLQTGGLWVGLFVGVFIESVIFLIVIYRINWDNEVQLARKRCNRPTESDCLTLAANRTIEVKTDEESQKIINTQEEELPIPVDKVLQVETISKQPESFQRVIAKRIFSFVILASILTASIISNALQSPLADIPQFYINLTLTNQTYGYH